MIAVFIKNGGDKEALCLTVGATIYFLRGKGMEIGRDLQYSTQGQTAKTEISTKKQLGERERRNRVTVDRANVQATHDGRRHRETTGETQETKASLSSRGFLVYGWHNLNLKAG